MPKYLFKASYSDAGLSGLLSEGATARKAAVDTVAASVGGTIDAMYFAFGATDVYAIVDFPDDETAAAVALRIGASGAVSTSTTS